MAARLYTRAITACSQWTTPTTFVGGRDPSVAIDQHVEKLLSGVYLTRRAA
jgi:hypothetical protein